jgi:hypothetical protein
MLESDRITSDSIVDLILYLKWKSSVAVHTDGYQAKRVNIWRDLLPQVMVDALMKKEVGERLQVPLKDGDIVASFKGNNNLAEWSYT